MMTKLTELEICKRIAEIDKVEFDYNDERVMYWRKGDDSPVETYNPLTDDTLCFQLMVKYKISLLDDYLSGNKGKWTAERHHTYFYQSVDESPNKAILLAIIEAHKEL